MDRRTFVFASGITGAALGGARPLPGQDKPAPKLKLKFAVNIGTHFTSHPMLERLRLVAEAGFPAVENNGLRRLERPAGAAEPNYTAIEKYGETLRSLGIAQATWGTNPCAGACDSSLVDKKQHPQFLKHLEETIKIAPMVGGTISTCTSGIELPKITAGRMTANVIEGLKRAAEMLEKAGGPILVLEPLNIHVDHPGYHVVTSEHGYTIAKAVGSPKVKILFDIYHQQISEGNLIPNIRNYIDEIGYFQFGDHPGRHEPFTGEINYKSVFRAIHELGYQGMLGGEYSPAGGGGDEASLASIEAIRQADAW